MLSRKLGFKVPMADRFWPMVDRRGPDDCWPWKGHLVRGQYGQISDGTKQIGAHRASLIIDGRDPKELDALHSCHNPSCVNPNHLRPGTHKENMKDAIDAGRFVFAPSYKGEDANNVVLTEKEVLEIRRLNKIGRSQRELGSMYGVDPKTVWKIVNRKTWAHVA